MNRRKWFIVIIVICFLTLGFFTFINAFVQPKLANELNEKLNNITEKNWFNPSQLKCYTDVPLEFYSAPEILKIGMNLSITTLEHELRARSYRKNLRLKAVNKDRLKPGWFISLNKSDCYKNISLKNSVIAQDNCLIWRDSYTQQIYHAGFIRDSISVLQRDFANLETISLRPFLFAQYEGGEPILKQCTAFNAFPLYCALAVQAAEDHNFVVHKGISKKGILRAIWRNIRSARFSQGGSTITQQVIKNMFLSSKKSLRRKFKEQILAQELEKIFTKEQILEAYLNIVYMGQSGSFRVHGFGAASLFYIGKPVSDLNLGECAFLAGIIQSPGKYNLFLPDHHERILKRRNHILNTIYRLEEDGQKLISHQELLDAIKQGLPTPSTRHHIPSIYFTDTVHKRISSLKVPFQNGIKVFTALNPYKQKQAFQAVKEGIHRLENNSKLGLSKNSNLQISLISLDIPSVSVQAVIGGRNFKISQFNRVLQSRRQIGSLMKPIAMLSALVEDPSLHPLSTVTDKKISHHFENQTWNPKNYKNRYRGEVALYEVLKYSLNSAQARLSLKIGLKPLIHMIKTLGGPEIKTIHPSLILGAVEMNPWEVAQVFSTIGRMGNFQKLHIIKEIKDWKNQSIYHYDSSISKQVVDPKKTATLVSMLQQVVQSGTARSLKHFPSNIAGKTGTTNDEKDSWFIGFTPEILTVVWLGFDDNRTHYLTGSEGAVPVWHIFMKKILKSLSVKTFHWPEGVVLNEITETLNKENPDKESSQQKISLIFEEEMEK